MPGVAAGDSSAAGPPEHPGVGGAVLGFWAFGLLDFWVVWLFGCLSCQHSLPYPDKPAVRYNGPPGLLPYVATSAGSLLSKDAYSAWTETISDKAKEDYAAIHRYWEARRVGIIDRTQRWLMDRFLRTNGICEGAKDYYGVVEMLMTMDTSCVFAL